MGVSKILTKDLSHPHYVFPTLSFVLSLALSLRRRIGDDIAPSAVKKMLCCFSSSDVSAVNLERLSDFIFHRSNF